MSASTPAIDGAEESTTPRHIFTYDVSEDDELRAAMKELLRSRKRMQIANKVLQAVYAELNAASLKVQYFNAEYLTGSKYVQQLAKKPFSFQHDAATEPIDVEEQFAAATKCVKRAEIHFREATADLEVVQQRLSSANLDAQNANVDVKNAYKEIRRAERNEFMKVHQDQSEIRGEFTRITGNQPKHWVATGCDSREVKAAAVEPPPKEEVATAGDAGYSSARTERIRQKSAQKKAAAAPVIVPVLQLPPITQPKVVSARGIGSGLTPRFACHAMSGGVSSVVSSVANKPKTPTKSSSLWDVYM